MSKQSSSVISALSIIEQDQAALLKQGEAMVLAYEGAVYPVDFLSNAALNRALALGAGFAEMIKMKNLICAGSLLRLQLDTAARFRATFLVDNPHEFAMEVFRGVHIRKIRDASGNLMNDRYLMENLNSEYPWVLNVYEQMSDYVHLSSTHISSSFRMVDKNLKTFNAKIGAEDREFPAEIYIDMIQTFHACTEILLRYIEGWTFTKSNPEKVAEMNEARKLANAESTEK